MKRKILVFNIFLILTAAGSLSAEEILPFGENRFATPELSIESPVNPGDTIIISSASNLSGKLTVTAGDIDQALFRYRKVLKTSAQSRAGIYAEMIEVDMEKSPLGLHIFLRAPNPAPWTGSDDAGLIEGELNVPAGSPINIEAEYFDMEMEGPFNAVENRSSFGRVDVRNVTDRLYLSTVNQDIITREIKGHISVSTSNADIRIDGMISESEPARVKNENGNILMKDIKGVFVIGNSYGKIRLNDVTLTEGTSRIESVHCPIRIDVKNADKAELSISNSYEDVRLLLEETVSANFLLMVESGSEIHVDGLRIRPVTVQGDRLQFVTGDGNANIEINIEGAGNINIEGYPGSTR